MKDSEREYFRRRRAGDGKGNTQVRRNRKHWLLRTFGDGTSCLCQWPECTTWLTFNTLTVDRFPIPGRDGGRYERGNIRPICVPHSRLDGYRFKWEDGK
jgi:hypothetical protein